METRFLHHMYRLTDAITDNHMYLIGLISNILAVQGFLVETKNIDAFCNMFLP